MKTDRITVVPDDKIIIKNGVGLIFDFESPKGVHAVQWANGKGHVEYTDGSPNRSLTEEDYELEVAPFATAWDVERGRLDAEEEAAETARLEIYNSRDARAERIRVERNRRIAETDYLLMADYPISTERLEKVKEYRQVLRDMPQQDGFPWLGDVNDPTVPWPETPGGID